MQCPVDPRTYTIRMEIDGEEKQFCQHCRTFHERSTTEVKYNAAPLLTTYRKPFDPYRNKQK